MRGDVGSCGNIQMRLSFVVVIFWRSKYFIPENSPFCFLDVYDGEKEWRYSRELDSEVVVFCLLVFFKVVLPEARISST